MGPRRAPLAVTKHGAAHAVLGTSAGSSRAGMLLPGRRRNISRCLRRRALQGGGWSPLEAPAEPGTSSWHGCLHSQDPMGELSSLPLLFGSLSAVIPWGDRGVEGALLWHVDPDNDYRKASYQGLQTPGKR